MKPPTPHPIHLHFSVFHLIQSFLSASLPVSSDFSNFTCCSPLHLPQSFLLLEPELDSRKNAEAELSKWERK